MSDLTKATFARHRDLVSRDSQELMGICRGIIADGSVCQREADFLLRWLRDNEEVASVYPGSLLAERLVKIFEDGVVDDAESAELLELLQNLTGENDMTDFERKSSIFGIDVPQPQISFVEENFCLTGTFEYGSRGEVENILRHVGATIKNDVVKRDSLYLVVGTFVSELWKFSSYGRKLEKAIAMRQDGYMVSIVTEAHMFDELERIGFIAR